MVTYQIPANVHITYMSWDEIVELFQSKFDFEIALATPYKLCDFRPAYGEIFEDYLQDYDFWGYCDIDLFWGRIRRFVTDDVLAQYDKIYSRGHCSLYRNNSKVNSWYRNLPCRGFQRWQDVFSKCDSCCFDEWAGHCGGGISMIIKENGIPIYDEADMADLKVNKGRLVPNRKGYADRKIYFRIEEDGCFIYGGAVACNAHQGEMIKWVERTEIDRLDEVVYVHFQKRKIEINITEDSKAFFLSAPAYVSNAPRIDFFGVRKYELTALYKRAVNKLKSV